MAIGYAGPFNGLGGGGFAGWSNFVTGAGTFFTRYRDGDPASSFVWREMYGNVNYQLAQSKRPLWQDTFHGVSSADPTFANTGTDKTSLNAIYAIAGPFILTPNTRRGRDVPPNVDIRVRIRRQTGSSGTHTVRVYAVGRLDNIVTAGGWNNQTTIAANGIGLREFTTTSDTYPASPGWSTEASMTIPVNPENRYCSRVVWDYPRPPPSTETEAVTVLVCYFVIAGTGASGNGPLVAAIQIREEAPGA